MKEMVSNAIKIISDSDVFILNKDKITGITYPQKNQMKIITDTGTISVSDYKINSEIDEMTCSKFIYSKR